jgi:hypothetical protein
MFVTSGGLFQRSTSSARYKNSITPYTKGLTEVLELKPISFKGNNDGDKIFAGFLAEDVDALGLTEYVQYDDQGQPDALSYASMVAILTKAIQELSATVQAQASDITSLKAKLGM